MSRINLWSKSVPRAELDQRAREARLQLDQVHRLYGAWALAAPSGLERVLRLVGSGISAGRERRIATDGRPPRRAEMAEVAILTCSPHSPSRSGGNGARRPVAPETSAVHRFRRTMPAGPKTPPAGLGHLRAC